MFNILQFDIEEFLKQNKKTIMAIEGRAASGKTTLANFLGKKYNATIFHIDDFFLPIKLQTPKRLSKAGENIDHERFLYEILLPIKNGET
ncbi:MAG: uridine kinase, partial [Christensenellaceae bacterium]|nr:uridine kinase [Christensenellaceae bacterium]